MVKIVFIRHGKTFGNTLKRYIGTTDEPLLADSIIDLAKKSYPQVQKLYCSPLQRAMQTAQAIYSGIPPIVIDDLRECDFGEFENKNYIELADSLSYNRWIKSNSTLPFPKGEAVEAFKARCVEAFKNIAKENMGEEISIAVVAHGGTIMSILEELSEEKQGFYNWQAENGGGYIATLRSDYTLKIIEKI